MNDMEETLAHPVKARILCRVKITLRLLERVHIIEIGVTVVYPFGKDIFQLFGDLPIVLAPKKAQRDAFSVPREPFARYRGNGTVLNLHHLI